MCKKQISLRFPDLNIEDMQIDPNLVDGDEDAEVNEDETTVHDATLLTAQNPPNVIL